MTISMSRPFSVNSALPARILFPTPPQAQHTRNSHTMSDPRTPVPSPAPHPHNPPASSSSGTVILYDPPAPSPLTRSYRKGNWTVQETLTLITAKRLDDDRRSASRSSAPAASASPTTPRSAEQRWKWVENYCWHHDCLRSQNQCNDKWDNLLRDYKKVRDFESRPDADQPNESRPSYWSMDRHDRKERNLPTNLSPEVYEALADVLSRRNARRSCSSTSFASAAATPVSCLPRPHPADDPPPQTPAADSPPPLLPPPPPPPQAAATAAPAPQPSVSAEVSESDESDADEPDTKRRKLKSLGSSVVRSASVLARTLMACEEKREQRHRELLELEERRVKLEEERTEMNRQAVSGLISAVNGLSNAIHAFVSRHRNPS